MENVAVDEEWVALIIDAKKMGIPLEEIRQFLTSSGQKA